MRRLGTEQRAFLAASTEAYHRLLESSHFSTEAFDYLRERGLADYTARYQLGYVGNPFPGHEMMAGRIAIPYLTPAGVVNIKFRCIRDHVCKDAGCPKYMATEGSGVYLYNARAVLAAQDTVVLCEGEFDAMAVSAIAEVPAVGYPGTFAWQQQKHWPRVFTGLDVVVVADGDEPGIKAAKAVARSLTDPRLVVMPDGEDSNSMLVKEGADAFRERLGLDH